MLAGTEAHQALSHFTDTHPPRASRYLWVPALRRARRTALGCPCCAVRSSCPRLRGLPHAPGCVVIGVPLPFLASIYERSTDPWRADPRAAAAMGVQPRYGGKVR